MRMMDSKPMVVAGPCSAESYEQLRRTAAEVMQVQGVCAIRCGVWKPRTRPGGFEGCGEEALRWIADLCGEHPDWHFCCEVASPLHVEMAMRYGIGMFWIGARTTTDPFAVSEIAQALSGTRATVMVKNSPVPSASIWLGAIERVERSGVERVMAVHRGFATFATDGMRNTPLWDIPIEMRRLRPDVALLCDPSHIAGLSSRVGEIARMAMSIGFDGLMVEVHHAPAEALTDGQQQLRPRELAELMASLPRLRDDEVVASQQLSDLRSAIDDVDRQLLSLLGQRMRLSRAIAEVKHSYNLPILQPSRWQQVLQSRLDVACQMGLDEGFVKEMLEKIHAESVRVQAQEEE